MGLLGLIYGAEICQKQGDNDIYNENFGAGIPRLLAGMEYKAKQGLSSVPKICNGTSGKVGPCIPYLGTVAFNYI